MKDMVNGYYSDVYGNTVGIVPAVKVPPEKFVEVSNELEKGVRALEIALGPIQRIVHGDATADDLEPVIREEIVLAAQSRERAKIVSELMKLSYDYFSKNNFPSAAAFSIAADRVRNGKIDRHPIGD
jgi:hypothetical protein